MATTPPQSTRKTFTDANGHKIGKSESEYRYEATGCDNNKCKGYTLRADLEKEDDFVKSNNK